MDQMQFVIGVDLNSSFFGLVHVVQIKPISPRCLSYLLSGFQNVTFFFHSSLSNNEVVQTGKIVVEEKINLTGFKPRSISNSNRIFKWIQFLNYYNKIETASLVNLIHSLHIFFVFIKIYKLNVKILGHATRALHVWNISQYISHNDM